MARQAGPHSLGAEEAGSAHPHIRQPVPDQEPAEPDTAQSQPAPSQRSAHAGFLRRYRGRLLLALLVVAAVAGYLTYRGLPKPTHYVLAPVTRGAVVQSIATTGTVNPVVTVQVGSYVSGIIRELNCDYNTRVKAGQLCAKIDPRPYQLTVDQNEANLASAKAQLAKDQANLAYAKTIYDRDMKLFAEKLVSPDTVDSDKSKYDQAKAQIGLDQADISQRQAALHAAQVNLGYTDIVSPVDGIVISRNVDVGQTVAASFQTPTLFLIAKDLTKMQVDTNVSETDVGQAKVGQKATFTVEAYPNKVFDGQVTQVRQAPITVQNVVTYDVVVSVDNPQLELLPGMTANTRIVTAEKDDVLRVPLQAIRFTPGGFHRTSASGAPAEARPGAGAYGGAGGRNGAGTHGRAGTRGGEDTHGGASARVWILRDGKPHAVRVMTGLQDNSYVAITGGDLKQGDQVIVNEIGSGSTAQAGEAQRQRRPTFMRF